MDIEDVIARLKAKHGAKTDQDLARALHLGRSTVGSWRARGSVPERYVRSLDADARAPVPFGLVFDEMSAEEHLALCLALMRLIRDFGPIVKDQREFLSKGDALGNIFVRFYAKALEDMQIAPGSIQAESWHSHFNVLVYDEFFGAK